jgi:hypothetical protein
MSIERQIIVKKRMESQATNELEALTRRVEALEGKWHGLSRALRDGFLHVSKWVEKELKTK